MTKIFEKTVNQYTSLLKNSQTRGLVKKEYFYIMYHTYSNTF